MGNHITLHLINVPRSISFLIIQGFYCCKDLSIKKKKSLKNFLLDKRDLVVAPPSTRVKSVAHKRHSIISKGIMIPFKVVYLSLYMLIIINFAPFK